MESGQSIFEPTESEQVSGRDIEEVKEIRDELKKDMPSYTNVKYFIEKIKERNYEIYKNLMVIVKNPTVTKALSDAVKKDLDDI